MPLSGITFALVLSLPVTEPAPALGPAVQAIAEASPDAQAGTDLIRSQGKAGLSALGEAVKKSSGKRRARLLEAMGRTRNADAEAVLTKEAAGGDEEVRAGAIRGLGYLGTKTSLAAVQKYAGTSSRVLREAVVDAISSQGADSWLRARALWKSADPRERHVALLVLARGDDVRMMDTAIPEALKSSSRDLKLAGIALAGKRKSTDHSAALLALATGSDVELAKASIDAFAAMKSGSSTPFDLARVVAAPSSAEASWRHAFGTLRGFGRYGFSGLTEALITSEPPRRAALIDSLVPEATTEEVIDMVSLLAHPVPARVELAQTLLAKLGERADDAAIAVMAGNDPSGRRVARDYLVRLPRERVEKKLLDAAGKGDPAHRAVAIEVYAALAKEASAEVVEALLADKEPVVRAAAAQALGGFTGAPIDRALTAVLEDPDPVVRVAATRGIAKKLNALRAEAVARAVDDATPEVRLAAIGVLAAAKDAKIVSVLERCVRDGKRTEDERLEACRSLGKMKVPAASELMLNLVTDKDPSVRRIAARAVEGSR